MKIIKDEMATLQRGRRVTVVLDPGESLVFIKPNCYYRLGGQVEDIVQSHVIIEAGQVYWCSITQKWEQA